MGWSPPFSITLPHLVSPLGPPQKKSCSWKQSCTSKPARPVFKSDFCHILARKSWASYLIL